MAIDGTPPPASEPARAIAPVSAPTQLLPANTVAWLSVRGARRVAEIAGRDRLVAAFPEAMHQAAGEVDRVLGRDLLDPAAWPAAGLDPDGEVGLAVLQVRPLTIVLTARLSNPGRFRELAIQVAARTGERLTPTSLGGAEILRGEHGEAVVLREPFAALVVQQEASGDQDAAMELATIDPGRSLAADPTFAAEATATVGADLRGFASVGAMVRAILGAPRPVPPGSAPVTDTSNDAEEAERRLLALVGEDLTAVSFRLDAGADTVVLEAHLVEPPDGPWRRLVRDHEGPPPLLSSLDGRLLLGLAGEFDVDAAITLLDAAARAESRGQDGWTDAVDETRDLTGVDLQAEVRPLLTGVAGLALTLDDPPPKRGGLEAPFGDRIGLAVTVQVSDPAAALALVERAAKHLDLDGRRFRPDRRSGGFVVSIPKWRALHLAVAGDHVVLTTDPGLARRLAAGTAGTLRDRTRPPTAWAAIATEDASVTAAADLAAMGLVLFVPFTVDSAVSMPPAVTGPGVRKSRRLRAKEKEIAALDARIAKARVRADAAEVGWMMDAVEPFGLTVLRVEPTEDGLRLRGGQFPRVASVAALVEHAVRLEVVPMMTPEEEELGRMFEMRSELEQEAESNPGTGRGPGRRAVTRPPPRSRPDHSPRSGSSQVGEGPPVGRRVSRVRPVPISAESSPNAWAPATSVPSWSPIITVRLPGPRPRRRWAT